MEIFPENDKIEAESGFPDSMKERSNEMLKRILPFIAAFLTIIITLCLYYAGIHLSGDSTASGTTVPGDSVPHMKSPPSNQQLLSRQHEEERLRALPYVCFGPIAECDENKKGVMTYIPEACEKGLNFYCSMKLGEAYLMDMKGNIAHTWSGSAKNWQAAALDKDGSLYYIVLDTSLVRMDWNSRPVWTSRLRYHNYISFAENGDVLTFTRDIRKIRHKGVEIPLLNDSVTILSPDGKVKKRIPLYDLFGSLIPEHRLDIIARSDLSKIKGREVGIYDVFHSNSVQKIEKDVPGLCKKGDLLLSIREINLVALIDPEKRKVVWQWGPGVLDGQHSATLLDNGHILLLDNRKKKKGFSRVLEVDPLKKRIVYEYKADPPSSFFTQLCGAVQRLDNGNLLITESEKGRVFEVTAGKQIVWEYYNKNILKKHNLRELITRMTRTDPELSAKLREKLDAGK